MSSEPMVIEAKTGNDRAVMHVLYAMHTVAWLSLGMLAVIAVIVNYIRRADEPDSMYRTHHGYMIATFWWTLFWLAITSPLWLLLVFPGWIAWTIVGLWYLYRCIRGWVHFTNGKLP